MRKKIVWLAWVSLVSATGLRAQQEIVRPASAPRPSPPIPVEAFAGSRGLVFQMTVSRHFAPASRLGFFNVTNFSGDYASTHQQNEYLSQAFVTADIWKGFAVNAGGSMHSYTGFRPSAGVQYVLAGPRVLVLVLPRFDLTQTHNFETFGLVEYKPKLSENWGLYTRAQGLFNYNVDQQFQERSYLWLRAGVSYRQYQVGVGSNLDFYGPQKINRNSFGGFVRADLF